MDETNNTNFSATYIDRECIQLLECISKGYLPLAVVIVADHFRHILKALIVAYAQLVMVEEFHTNFCAECYIKAVKVIVFISVAMIACVRNEGMMIFAQRFVAVFTE